MQLGGGGQFDSIVMHCYGSGVLGDSKLTTMNWIHMYTNLAQRLILPLSAPETPPSPGTRNK